MTTMATEYASDQLVSESEIAAIPDAPHGRLQDERMIALEEQLRRAHAALDRNVVIADTVVADVQNIPGVEPERLEEMIEKAPAVLPQSRFGRDDNSLHTLQHTAVPQQAANVRFR